MAEEMKCACREGKLHYEFDVPSEGYKVYRCNACGFITKIPMGRIEDLR